MKTVLTKFHFIFLNLLKATEMVVVSKRQPTRIYFNSEQQHL